MWKRTLPALVLAVSTIVTAHAAKLPRPAPPFTIDLLDGKQIKIESYKGKIVVVAFILTTCPHCQKYVQLLNKVQPSFKAQGVEVVGVAIEENAKSFLGGFTRAFAPPYPMGYKHFVDVHDFLEQPRTQALHMPVIAFVDRQGTILKQHQAGDPFIENDPEKNLRDALQGLVKGTINVASVKKEEAEKAAKAPSVTFVPVGKDEPKTTPVIRTPAPAPVKKK